METTNHNAIVNSRSLPFSWSNRGIDSSSCSINPLIRESHDRCHFLGLKAFESCDYSVRALADSSIALERHSRLLAQTNAVLQTIESYVADFGGMIVLTDETGTILRTHCHGPFVANADRVALRPGISWAESSKGTNAIGTALVLESSICVHADEHFFQSNHFLSCAATPILDHTGNILGILDVSCDKHVFRPQTLALVELCARTIEQNWFLDKFQKNLQLHFHPTAEWIGTPGEGIIALGEDGQILGSNRVGRQILGVSASALRMQGVQRFLGMNMGDLLERLHRCAPVPLQLTAATGKSIFVRASGNGPTIFASAMSMPRNSDLHAVAPVTAAALALKELHPLGNMEPICKIDEIDAGDAQVHSVTQRLKHVIDKDIAILILGETGTGKELLANAIHQYSVRRKQAFVAINCASIPEQLIESELFGYEEGAFTGAKRKGCTGKLLQANGGTLFLDEIGDMPLPMQARLLRVLQERKVVPLGGHRAYDFDVNLICATHRNLHEMMAQKMFRDDLFYRINGISVKLPPLREREDLVAMCQNVLRKLSPHRPLTIQSSLLEAFLRYSWPGNLRQLNNVLKTAAVLVGSDHEINKSHLPDDFCEELANLPSPTRPKVLATTMPAEPVWSGQANNLEQVEISAILRVLKSCAGNVTLASRQLNVSRNTIYRRLKKGA